MELEGRSYVLEAHRGTPEPPVFHFAMPTAGDIMDARASASVVKGEGEHRKESLDFDALAVGVVARALRRVDGITRGGVAQTFPATGDLAERIEFVRRLPYAWLGELGAAVQAEADLDEEDERGSAPIRGGDGGGETGDVRLREMSTTDAA